MFRTISFPAGSSAVSGALRAWVATGQAITASLADIHRMAVDRFGPGAPIGCAIATHPALASVAAVALWSGAALPILALTSEGSEEGGGHGRALKIAAASIFRELRETGYSREEIAEFAAALLEANAGFDWPAPDKK